MYYPLLGELQHCVLSVYDYCQLVVNETLLVKSVDLLVKLIKLLIKKIQLRISFCCVFALCNCIYAHAMHIHI